MTAINDMDKASGKEYPRRCVRLHPGQESREAAAYS